MLQRIAGVWDVVQLKQCVSKTKWRSTRDSWFDSIKGSNDVEVCRSRFVARETESQHGGALREWWFGCRTTHSPVMLSHTMSRKGLHVCLFFIKKKLTLPIHQPPSPRGDRDFFFVGSSRVRRSMILIWSCMCWSFCTPCVPHRRVVSSKELESHHTARFRSGVATHASSIDRSSPFVVACANQKDSDKHFSAATLPSTLHANGSSIHKRHNTKRLIVVFVCSSRVAGGWSLKHLSLSVMQPF